MGKKIIFSDSLRTMTERELQKNSSVIIIFANSLTKFSPWYFFLLQFTFGCRNVAFLTPLNRCIIQIILVMTNKTAFYSNATLRLC